MEALVWHGGANLSVDQIDPPNPAPGEVVVDIELAGICGSDLHAYRGHGGARKPPLVLGHEAVGRIQGDDNLYALFPLRGCGECAACRRGAANVCTRRRLLGLDRQGTFAEKVAIAADDLVPVPAGVSAESATLAEPLATALAALDGLELGSGTRVAVIGLGPIGLLTAYAALARGSSVVGVDVAQTRRSHAEALGVDQVLESAEMLESQAFDAVIDAVGMSATWAAAVRAAAGGGAVVIVGLGETTGPIDIGRIVRAALTVRGTYAYTREHFEGALRMFGEHPMSLSWVKRLPLDAGAAAFGSLASVTSDATKVLLEVNSSS